MSVVKVICDGARTVVRTADVDSGEHEVKVGLHKKSVSSPLLFITVMNVGHCRESCYMLMI